MAKSKARNRRTGGNSAMPIQPQIPAGATAGPAAGAAPPATNFKCAACEKTRPLEKDGHPYFITAKNEGRLCMVCVGERDRQALADGRITMNVQREGNDWWAISLSGKNRYRLNIAEGQTEMQMLSDPRFVDRDGNLWTGRMYPRSGLIHFQKKGKAAGVTPSRRKTKTPTAV